LAKRRCIASWRHWQRQKRQRHLARVALARWSLFVQRRQQDRLEQQAARVYTHTLRLAAWRRWNLQLQIKRSQDWLEHFALKAELEQRTRNSSLRSSSTTAACEREQLVTSLPNPFIRVSEQEARPYRLSQRKRTLLQDLYLEYRLRVNAIRLYAVWNRWRCQHNIKKHIRVQAHALILLEAT
jgi:hypothetical protein